MVLFHILLLPLPVFTAALNVSDERVERHSVVVMVVGVVRRGKSEVGAKLEAAMAVIWGFIGGVGNEEEEKNGYCNVYDNGSFAHSVKCRTMAVNGEWGDCRDDC